MTLRFARGVSHNALKMKGYVNNAAWPVDNCWIIGSNWCRFVRMRAAGTQT